VPKLSENGVAMDSETKKDRVKLLLVLLPSATPLVSMIVKTMELFPVLTISGANDTIADSRPSSDKVKSLVSTGLPFTVTWIRAAVIVLLP
jgi:hypothetical protein